MAPAAVRQGGSVADLLDDLLRDPPREPDHRRPAGAEVPLGRRSRRRDHRALPHVRRAVLGATAGARRVLLRAGDGRRRLRGVAQLDPVPERRELGREGSAIPQGHRLLRVPLAVPRVRGRLGVRRPARGPHRDRGVPLPQRWHPPAEPVAARHAAGEGPPVGDPRAHGAHQDGAVLPRALRARVLPSRLRRRRQLHRRARAVAGPEPADGHLDRGRGAVHRQHLPQGLGVPDHRGRALGVHLARRRHDLPGGDPALRRTTERVLARAAVHRTQHRDDAVRRSASTARRSRPRTSTTTPISAKPMSRRPGTRRR